MSVIRRRLLGLVVVAGLLGAVFAAEPPGTDPSIARADSPQRFARVPATPLGGEQSTYALVGTGNGIFHSLARENTFLRQSIVYRRSEDNGLTWHVGNYFAGEGGSGATRPALAVDGKYVAVGFIGCLPVTFDICEEVPFVAVSDSEGLMWSSPLMLTDQGAGSVAVARHAGEFWVAWNRRNGGIEVRALNDAGSAITQSFSFPSVRGLPEFAADHDTLALTAGRQVLIRRAGAWIGPHGFEAPLRGVAVADRRVHVLVAADDALQVATADARPFDDGTFKPPVVVGPRVGYGSIAARRGLVAVSYAVRNQAFVTTSHDNGATFTPPALGFQSALPERGTRVSTRVSVAPLGTSGPIARFDWTVPDRYVDGSDLDDLPEPANSTGDPDLDAILVDIIDVPVTFNGCSSSATAGLDIEPDGYRWTLDGEERPETSCTFTADLRDGVPVEVTLEVTDTSGQVGRSTMTVTPEDLLVVSIGDSVASGEGNPHTNATSPWLSFLDDIVAKKLGVPPDPVQVGESWQDGPCHRSAYAGPALAAKRLEDRDPRTSVTFVQLSCSGAAIMDVPATPGALPQGPDDPTTGGLLDDYEGVEPRGTAPRPSQLDQLAALIGHRPVDALMISIGANDVKFSTVVEACLMSIPPAGCQEGSTPEDLATRLDDLPRRYAALAERIDAMGIDADSVFITEYFDVTGDSYGRPNLRCVADGAETLARIADATEPLLAEAPYLSQFHPLIHAVAAGGLATTEEARWAKDYVVRNINAAVAAGAFAHGWNYVGGVAEAYARRGYCSDNTWIVRIMESISTQADYFGAFHPNRAGHAVYGDIIASSIARALLPDGEDSGAPGDEDSLGDVYLLATDEHEVMAVGMRDLGEGAYPVSARRLSRVVNQPAALAITAPIAADVHAAVAVWNEGWDYWRNYRAWAAPVVVSENLGVQHVEITQAPAGASEIIAGRDTLVRARISARVIEPRTVTVRLRIDRDGEVVEHVEERTFEPGDRDYLLPLGDPLRFAEGTVVATVEVTDPGGGRGASLADNVAVSSPVSVVEGREFRVAYAPVNVDGRPEWSCSSLATNLRPISGPFAALNLPVKTLTSDVFCTPPATAQSSERGALEVLLDLDVWARNTGQDAVIGIVPVGWLEQHSRGAVGISAAGLRSALVQQGEDASTVVHEIAHMLHQRHTAGIVKLVGTDTQRRVVIEGRDWMYEYKGSTRSTWVSEHIWSNLLRHIGGPDKAPWAWTPAANHVLARGSVVENPDGTYGLRAARWVRSGTRPVYDDDTELEIGRMTARVIDTDTSHMTETPVPLAPVSGQFGPGADPNAGPIGLAFIHAVDLPPGADLVQLVLDGVVVHEQAVTPSIPTVTVTEPLAGSVYGRGDPMDIVWTAADADGDTLTYDVLVSPDGGTTWQPLATGITETSLTVEAPENMHTDQAVVRVLASDGVNVGHGDSVPFAIRGRVEVLPERVVYVRIERKPGTLATVANPTTRLNSYGLPGDGLWTMTPTGTEVELLVPYEMGGEGNVRGPLRPAWSPNGRQVAFDAVIDRPGAGPWREVFIVNRDGTGLRRLTPPETHPHGYICASWSADGTEILTIAIGIGMQIVNVQTGATMTIDTPYPFTTMVERSECPRFGPDPDRILFRTTHIGDRYLVITDREGEWLHSINQGFGGYWPAWSHASHQIAAISQSPGWTVGVFDEQLQPLGATGGGIVPNLDWYGSTGFGSSGDLWFINTQQMWPAVYTRCNPSLPGCSIQTVREAVGHFCISQSPRHGEPQPPITCYLPDNSGIPVVPSETPSVGMAMADWHPGISEDGTGSLPVRFPDAPPLADADAGGPYEGIAGYPLTLDAGASSVLHDLDSGQVLVGWDLDADGVFEDASGVRPAAVFDEPGTYQVRVRIVTASGLLTSAPTQAVISPAPPLGTDVAPDDSAPPGEAPVPADQEVTVLAAETTRIQLRSTAGDTMAFELRDLPEPSEIEVATPFGPPPTDGVVTDDEGYVDVTPGAHLVGTTFTFGFRVAGTSGPQGTVTLRITGPRAPIARLDRLTVTQGVLSVFEPSTLLDNDEDPDEPATFASASASGLRLISVEGLEGGAWLGHDGKVYVLASNPGTAFLRYAVVGRHELVSDGFIFLTVHPAQQPTTSTSTAPPSTSAPGTSAPGTSAPATSAPATSAPAPPTSSPPTTDTADPPATTTTVVIPTGTLPATGSGMAGTLVRWALLAALGGLLLVVVGATRSARRSRPSV